MPHRRCPGVLSERLEPPLRCRSYRKPTSGSACRRHFRTPLRITEPPTDRTSPPEAPASTPNSGNPSAPRSKSQSFGRLPIRKHSPDRQAKTERMPRPFLLSVSPANRRRQSRRTDVSAREDRPRSSLHESRIQMVLLRKNVRQVTGNTAIPTVHRHTEPAGQPTNGPQYFHRRDAATPNAPSHNTDPLRRNPPAASPAAKKRRRPFQFPPANRQAVHRRNVATKNTSLHPQRIRNSTVGREQASAPYCKDERLGLPAPHPPPERRRQSVVPTLVFFSYRTKTVRDARPTIEAIRDRPLPRNASLTFCSRRHRSDKPSTARGRSTRIEKSGKRGGNWRCRPVSRTRFRRPAPLRASGTRNISAALPTSQTTRSDPSERTPFRPVVHRSECRKRPSAGRRRETAVPFPAYLRCASCRPDGTAPAVTAPKGGPD